MKFEFQVCDSEGQCGLSVFVKFCFLSVFGAKRKHTRLINSENSKELVRISVLEEKLDLW